MYIHVETQLTPKTVPFSKRKLTMKFHYTNKVETPIWRRRERDECTHGSR